MTSSFFKILWGSDKGFILLIRIPVISLAILKCLRRWAFSLSWHERFSEQKPTYWPFSSTPVKKMLNYWDGNYIATRWNHTKENDLSYKGNHKGKYQTKLMFNYLSTKYRDSISNLQPLKHLDQSFLTSVEAKIIIWVSQIVEKSTQKMLLHLLLVIMA